MRTLQQTVWLAAACAIALLTSGCGPAKEGSAATSKQISRWKSQPQNKAGAALGLVVEEHGKEIRATIYGLKAGDGFVTEQQFGIGKYFPDRKALIVPIGLPAFGSIEDWLAMKAPHFIVPFARSSTNLLATLKSPGVPETPTELLRFDQ